MAKKNKTKEYLSKYFEVLYRFGISPNFKFEDKEKKIVKDIDSDGPIEYFDFCDRYDLKPSEAKKTIRKLVEKGAVEYNDSTISLTSASIKYLHSTKEQRKAEKKFRKFVDTLDENGLDEFMRLVDSFKIVPRPEDISLEALLEKGIVGEGEEEEAKPDPESESKPEPEPEPEVKEEEKIEEKKPPVKKTPAPRKRVTASRARKTPVNK